MLNDSRTWYSVELTQTVADGLKSYLRKADIYFEPSSVGNLVHFECLMTKDECDLVNGFLDKLVRTEVATNGQSTA